MHRFNVVSVRERGRGCRGGGGSGALEGAQGVAPTFYGDVGAVQGYPLLQRGSHFVKFFKVLGQSRAEDRRTRFEIVVRGGAGGVRGAHGIYSSSGPDDGAVLSHVDASVDVNLAALGGRDTTALGFWHAVLTSGAGLIFSVQHQLDPALSAALLGNTRITWY